MWATIKAGCKNFLVNSLSDKDNDFCPATGMGVAAAIIMMVKFGLHGTVADLNPFAQSIAIVIAAVAAKRWSENH